MSNVAVHWVSVYAWANRIELLIIYGWYNKFEHRKTTIQKNWAENQHKEGWQKKQRPRQKAPLYNPKMPTVKGMIEECEYRTPNVDLVIAAALITAHLTSHQIPSWPNQTARFGKVNKPSISLAVTTEDWVYFSLDGMLTQRQQNW